MANDNNTFESSKLNMNFRIDNDSVAGSFDTREFKQYNAENEQLISCAIKVREQRPFDAEAVRDLFDGYTAFVPFQFQVDNVLTMLNVFEGNGVFGDQVGLGKTIEAYMAMHAMSANGAIRNALIITTAKTAEQWKEEADRKFPGIFQTVVADDKNKTKGFEELFKLIEDDNDEELKKPAQSDRKLRVYIITVDQLRKHANNIDRAVDKSVWLEFMKEGLLNGDADYRARAYKPEGLSGEELKAGRQSYLKSKFAEVYDRSCMFFGEDFYGLLNKKWGEELADCPKIADEPEFFLARYGFNAFVFVGTPAELKRITGYEGDEKSKKQLNEKFNEKFRYFTFPELGENGKPTGRIICKYYLRDLNLCCPTVAQYVQLMKFFLTKLSESDIFKNNFVLGAELDDDKIRALCEQLFLGKSFSKAVETVCGCDASDGDKIFSRLCHEKPLEKNLTKRIILNKYVEILDEISENYRDLCALVNAESDETDRYFSALCGASEDGEQKRLVDLLVIDEVHGFVADGSGEQSADSADERSDDNARVLRNLAGRIAKKYCLLLSATPIRTQLSNVFDLAYISNMNRLGSNETSARAYFYRTVCGFDSDRPAFDFAEMIEGGRINRLNAMINSQFTRRRVTDPDIRRHMGEKKGEEAVRRTRSIINFYIEVAKRKERSNVAKEIAKQLELCYVLCLSERGEIKDLGLFEWLRGKSSEEIYKSKHRNLLVRVFNRGMIMYLQSGSAPFERDGEFSMRGINALIDWNRPETKSVSPFEPHGDVSQIIREVFTDGDFEESLQGRVVVYGYNGAVVGENNGTLLSVDDTKKIRATLKGMGRKVVEQEKQGFTTVTALNMNDVSAEVLVVDSGASAGLNLNDASALVLTQFDMVKNGVADLAEPLDIEQWIGRIFRTGQKNDCKIIIVLRSRAQGYEGDTKFLKYYYEVLGDEGGLDLFVGGKTEVSFVAPMLVSLLRKIAERARREDGGYNSPKLGLSVKFTGEKPKEDAGYDFHSLVRYFYNNAGVLRIVLDGETYEGDGVLDGLKAIIRKVCDVSKQ